MNLVKSKSRSPANPLGELLRHWRDTRGRSQIELSLDAGISQRHLSFIEIGRSVPSRETLIGIATALDIPLRDRNALLLAAGYAPIYAETDWDAGQMRSVTGALKRMLRQHDPFPAVVMDRYWNVLIANESAPRFFSGFVDMASRPKPRNLLHLMFDPAGMRPFIANWDQVASSLIERVHREAVGRVVDEKCQDLVAALLAYPGAKPEWRTPRSASAASELPVIPMDFIKDGATLSYFSMLTTVATPQTVVAQELRIESLFPMDEATEARHSLLMSGVHA